jgi:putative tryptophan/tyrosine transport system substrate-binding protein
LAPPTRAQVQTKLPSIGFLGPTAPDIWADWTKIFTDRLAELGWIDGGTVTIVHRWGYGRTERFGELAAELVALKVDVIVTSGSATRQAMKETLANSDRLCPGERTGRDWDGGESVSAGGNVTGLSLEAPELSGKRAELVLPEAVEIEAERVMQCLFEACETKNRRPPSI